MVFLAVSLGMAAAAAEDGWVGKTTQDGGAVFLSSGTLNQLNQSYISPPDTGPWYAYQSVSVCGGHPDRPDSDSDCLRTFVLCAGNTEAQGLGPAIAVFHREVDRQGRPLPGAVGRWDQVGITCHPALVPGASRALTMEMIRDAFVDTAFTVPTVNIQPEGDLTLVNLPTFFEAQFPETGFGPGEVDTPDPARMLGYRVEIRPVLKSVTYHLGDQVVGPTTSMGGPYPKGDIRATYARPGTREVRADIIYTGQFRVGGSDWFDIPGEVDLTGTPVTLTVREARSRLVTK